MAKDKLKINMAEALAALRKRRKGKSKKPAFRFGGAK